MWWECSECGSHLESNVPPPVCPACGIAGAVCVQLERGLTDDPEVDSLRDAWLLAGLEPRPRLVFT